MIPSIKAIVDCILIIATYLMLYRLGIFHRSVQRLLTFIHARIVLMDGSSPRDVRLFSRSLPVGTHVLVFNSSM